MCQSNLMCYYSTYLFHSALQRMLWIKQMMLQQKKTENRTFYFLCLHLIKTLHDHTNEEIVLFDYEISCRRVENPKPNCSSCKATMLCHLKRSSNGSYKQDKHNDSNNWVNGK